SDPTIRRFWHVDPLAKDYVYNSTYAFQENKLGMGIELEGAELVPHTWLVSDAVANLNGVVATILNAVDKAVDYTSAIVSRTPDNLDAIGRDINNDLNEFASHGPTFGNDSKV
ncbi:MAG: hypothetical protein CR989_05190, partial [Flavobacteriales bacterium]